MHCRRLYFATKAHCLKGADLSSRTCLMQNPKPLIRRCLHCLALKEHSNLLSSERWMFLPSYIPSSPRRAKMKKEQKSIMLATYYNIKQVYLVVHFSFQFDSRDRKELANSTQGWKQHFFSPISKLHNSQLIFS